MFEVSNVTPVSALTDFVIGVESSRWAGQERTHLRKTTQQRLWTDSNLVSQSSAMDAGQSVLICGIIFAFLLLFTKAGKIELLQ